MATRTDHGRRTPFLPESASRFLRRRAFEISGLALFALAGILALALASYDPSDPSFNTASTGRIANLIGAPGSYVSDLLLQTIGVAGALVVALIAGWAWSLVNHRRPPTLWLRLTMAPLGIGLAAVGLGALSAPHGWPIEAGLGGVWGHVIAALLKPVLIDGALGTGGFAALALSLGAFAFAGALGLPWSDWRAIWRGCYVATRIIVHLAVAGIIWVHERIQPTFDDDEAPPARTRTRRARPTEIVEPTLGLDDEEPARRRASRASTSRRASAKERATPRPKSRAQADADGQAALDLGDTQDYTLPELDLLATPPNDGDAASVSPGALERNARQLLSVLQDFSVFGEIHKVRPGPVVTLYEFVPQPGTRTSRVIGLADDIARSMSALSVRVATVPGRNVIGIELPNRSREVVYLRELLASRAYENTAARLILALGKDIGGAPVITDLGRMPHLLVAGTTGSGKSVAINCMILSLIYRLPPEQCKLILIDPKMLELSVYDDIPHLLTPVVTDAGKAVVALKWTVREMENRYQAMSKLGVRNIQGYNKRLEEARRKGEHLTRRVQTHVDPDTGEPVYEEHELDLSPMPFIVVVVDEMADLMLVAGKDIEGAVQRLAQMARAAGIHLIMATQRPSVDVITGTIKANFPTRISFQVTSKIDSRTIIGEQGAEQLLGQGDMLFLEGGGRLKRVHGPFVSDAEVERVAQALREQGRPDYHPEITEEPEATPGGLAEAAAEDPLYDQAVALVARERKASTSFVQRHLQIGYNRAARIIERMEAEGVVSQANHVGKREVLVSDLSGRDE